MKKTAVSAGSRHYCTSLEEARGENPEISEYLDLAFYEWCWYNDKFGIGETKLGKCLGISHSLGSLIFYWLLTANGMLVSRMTVSRITNIEAQNDNKNERITKLGKAIQERLEDEARVVVQGGKAEPKYWSEHPFNRDPGFQEDFSHIVSNEDVA